jgi:hypothetical protein
MATRTKRKKREAWHGKITGYVYHKCRCDDCRAAWAEYHLDYRKRRFKNGKAKCRVKGCKNRALPSAGNGLCNDHHERKMLLRKRAQARKSKERRKRRVTASS